MKCLIIGMVYIFHAKLLKLSVRGNHKWIPDPDLSEYYQPKKNLWLRPGHPFLLQRQSRLNLMRKSPIMISAGSWFSRMRTALEVIVGCDDFTGSFFTVLKKRWGYFLIMNSA
jgi:hypothetical protein